MLVAAFSASLLLLQLEAACFPFKLDLKLPFIQGKDKGEAARASERGRERMRTPWLFHRYPSLSRPETTIFSSFSQPRPSPPPPNTRILYRSPANPLRRMTTRGHARRRSLPPRAPCLSREQQRQKRQRRGSRPSAPARRRRARPSLPSSGSRRGGEPRPLPRPAPSLPPLPPPTPPCSRTRRTARPPRPPRGCRRAAPGSC